MQATSKRTKVKAAMKERVFIQNTAGGAPSPVQSSPVSRYLGRHANCVCVCVHSKSKSQDCQLQLHLSQVSDLKNDSKVARDAQKNSNAYFCHR